MDRAQYRPYSPDDPSRLGRLVGWYDNLTDWQRVQYGVAVLLFLVACSGYVLGLGSTILLRRVEAKEDIAAAADLDQVVAEELPLELLTPTPSPTSVPTPAGPTATLFSIPTVQELPVVPRPVPPTTAPRPAAPLPTPTPTRPRVVEAAPTAGPLTPGVAATATLVRPTVAASPNLTAVTAVPTTSATRPPATPTSATAPATPPATPTRAAPGSTPASQSPTQAPPQPTSAPAAPPPPTATRVSAAGPTLATSFSAGVQGTPSRQNVNGGAP